MPKRVRVQSLVLRDDRILMIKVRENGQEWYCLPGGGLESGETFAQGALRELCEECSVQGTIVRLLGHMIFAPDDEAVTFLVDIQDQEPVLGHDPEAEAASLPQSMVGLSWMRLDEVPERDRTYLWAAGLLGVGGFPALVESWGDAISYPGRQER